MIFNQVLGNINDIKNTENLHIEKIYINSEDTLKRILRVNSDHNHEYGIALSENIELKDGDILYKDDKNLIIIKVKRKKTILSYYQGNTLYSILKNSTYVSMIFVTAIAQVTDKTGTPMAQAIGILFLIDTYFTNLENIRLQINEINNCK